MKICDLRLHFATATISCLCILTVQDREYEVPVSFPEQELYTNAENHGRASWENEDVIAVVSSIVSRSCSI